MKGFLAGPGWSQDICDCKILVSRGETITFLNDGVVEARDTKVGLLGFDRTQELSTRPAHEIAAIGQQFG